MKRGGGRKQGGSGNENKEMEVSRALGLALGVLEVSVTSALVLVSISPRWNALTLLAADSTVLQASVLYSCELTSLRAFGIAEICQNSTPLII